MLNITIGQLNKIKPSEALQAMVAGLRENQADPCFQVNMDTFGTKNSEGICFGCAATCTIAKLNNQLYSDTVDGLDYEEFYGFNLNVASVDRPSWLDTELSEFESAMDSARLGDVWRLMDFTGVDIPDLYEYDDRFCLSTDDWQTELPKVELLITELIAAGL